MGYVPSDESMVAAVFLLIYFGIFLFALAYGVTAYIMGSLAVSTIADRRGIRNNWMAWIPFGSLWILGSISDQYKYLVKGKIKNRRKRLLALSIMVAVLYVALVFSAIVNSMMGTGPTLVAFVLATGFYAGLIALIVLQFMCYFDLFRSCDKENGTLFAVLSVVIWVLLPFLVFACRKRDGGMPPRKQPTPPLGYRPVAPVQIVQVEVPVAETPVEEIPVVEEPVKEIPVVETPVVEVPAEEPPAEELPAKPEEIAE